MATRDRAGNAYGSPAKAKTNAERKVNAQTYGPGYAPRFKPAGSAEHPSYQTPEGELGHPGDVKGAPKRKGYGNVLIDPVTNEWSNTPQ